MRNAKWSVVVSALALGAFTACGGGNKASSSSSQPASSSQSGSQMSQSASSDTGAATASSSSGQHPNWPTIGEVPQGMTMADVQQGAQIYHGQGNCYTCHGVDGKGTALAPNQTDTIWININGSYQSILHTVQTGVPNPKKHPSPMPPMGGAQLTSQQVHDVAAYIYAISHHKKG